MILKSIFTELRTDWSLRKSILKSYYTALHRVHNKYVILNWTKQKGIMRTSDRIINVFISLTLLIGISSCSESPLSDVEIHDPSSLYVSAHIYQDFDNNKELIIKVNDKNGNYVDILNGGVSVNGRDCELKHASFGGLGKTYVYYPSYYVDEFRVQIWYNSHDSYTFYIEAPYFPGFMTNKRVTHVDLRHSRNKFTGQNTYTETPFHNREIDFNFDIMKEESQMRMK